MNIDVLCNDGSPLGVTMGTCGDMETEASELVDQNMLF